MLNDNYAKFLRAKECLKKRKYKDAINLYEEILSIENDSEVMLSYARTLIFMIKNLDRDDSLVPKCRLLLNSALESDRKLNAMYELGNLERAIGDFLQARVYFKRTLSLYEKKNICNSTERNIYLFTIYELVSLEVELGNIEDANKYLEQYKSLSNSKDEKYSYLYLKISLNNRLENYDDSLLLCDEVKKYDNDLGLKLEASTLSMQGKYEEAMDKFLKISKFNTFRDEIFVYRNIISLCVKLNNIDLAINYFNKLKKSSDIDVRYLYVFEYFLKLKKGIELKEKSYSTSMLLDYDRDAAIEHIKLKHGEDFTCSVYDVFDKALSVLEEGSEKRVIINDVMEDHYIEFPYNIGIAYGVDTNVLVATTYINSTNIISMFPVPKVKKNSDEESFLSSSNKEKQMSRIDCFYARYRKKL